MNSYRLNDVNKRTEQHILEQIITNNGYDTSIISLTNPDTKTTKTITKRPGPNSPILGGRQGS
jgi:hypothetical protein